MNINLEDLGFVQKAVKYLVGQNQNVNNLQP